MDSITEDLLYDKFVCDMGRINGVDPSIYDNWINDSKSQFAFNQGIKLAEEKFKEQIEYLIKGIECEKNKKETLKNYLTLEGFEVCEFLNNIFVMGDES